MNYFLPIRSFSPRGRYFFLKLGRPGSASRWWLLSFLLTGLSSVGWGQCFNATAVSLVNSTTFTVGRSPQSVAVGDFNGDGKSDLAVANYFSDNISVLLGNGSGSFGAATSYTVASGPQSVVVGDFNSDGKPDLAVASSFSEYVSVLLGTGTGAFGPPAFIKLADRSGARSIAVGDFNSDGRPDLVTANEGLNNVSVLLGTGGGGFGPPTSFVVGNRPYSVAVGDFNGDGKPDLAVANNSSNNVSVLLGNGNGVFSAPISYTVGSSPQSVAVGDLNGDGKLDLAVGSLESASVSVLLGDGSGSFGEASNFAAGGSRNFGAYSVAVGDFNGDGKPDLAVANFQNVSVLLGNGNGDFGAPIPSNVGAPGLTRFVAVGDFNGDGKSDLAVTNYEANRGNNSISVLLSDGSGGFSAPFVSGPRSIVVNDFNGDGKPDLAVANDLSNNVSVLLGNGNGSFAPTSYTVGSSPRSVVVGDFNGDGKSDLAVTNQGPSFSSIVSVLLGNGSGGFGPPVPTAVGPSSAGSVAVGDFNGDGKLDLAVTQAGAVSVLLGNGSGGFEPPNSFTVGTNLGSVRVADLNGDGKPDLAVTGSDNVLVLLGNGSGGFGSPTSYTVGSSPSAVAVGDLNGDGRPDLATANFNSNNVSVLLGNGGGGFGPPTNVAVNPGIAGRPYFVAVGDFNSDNKLDLTVTQAGAVSVLPGNGSGGFGPPTSFTVGSGPFSVAVADFNGDGLPDLATANYNANNISVLLNCSPPPPPTNFAITGVTTVSCTTVTVTERRLAFAPQYTGLSGQPVSFSVVNEMMPTSSAGPHTLRLYTDNPTVILKAQQMGSPAEVSFAYDWLAACGAVLLPLPTNFAITRVATVSCTTVTATERRLTFTPQYTGLSGQPVSFSVVNEMMPTSSAGPYTLRLYTDNPTVILKAQPMGSPAEVSFAYDWLAACGTGGSLRLGIKTEPTTALHLNVHGNPVYHTVEVDVTGAENRSLHLSLTDMLGRLVGERWTERADATEQYRFDISAIPIGNLLLRASTQGQSKTVRILKSK